MTTRFDSRVRRAFQRSAVLAVLLSGATAPVARAQSAPDRDGKEVRELDLRGVHAVTQAELRESIATEASACRSAMLKPFCLMSRSHLWWDKHHFDNTEFKRDVLRIRVFYWKRGYREAQVDTSVVAVPHGLHVVFRVTEGRPTIVQRIEVHRPDSIFTDRQLRRLVLLHSGKPLNLLTLDSSIVRLRDAAWDLGYADAVVDQQVTAADTTGRVTITIDPRHRTTVGRVEITGTNAVSSSVVRQSLRFTEGDVFKRKDVTESQRALYESNLFKRATIVVKNPGDSAKDVEIRLQEAPLRDARVSGGFNTIEFLQTEGRFTHYNWTGGGRRLDVEASVGNLLAGQLNGSLLFKDVTTSVGADRGRFLAPTWNASVNVQQPWFRSPRNALAMSAFTHRRSAPAIFVDRGYGASATFTRELAPTAPLSANYRFEITTVEAGDVYFCVNYGVCDAPTIGALRTSKKLSPLALTASWDRTNDPLEPSKGFIAKAEVEHASTFTASDFRYNRAYADASIYHRFGRRPVLAGHLRLGVVGAVASTSAALGLEGDGSVLHPRKRFYAGGAHSVRGYGENQLGPRVLTIPADKLRGKGTDSTGTVSYSRCDPATPIQSCDPNATGLADNNFTPRPLGGTGLIEASTEFRVPLFGDFTGAAFIDGALVSSRGIARLGKGVSAITPGIGVRYRSPVGPIRVDLGVNPGRSQQLDVVTENVDPVTGQRTLVRLDGTRSYSGVHSFLDRLTLHLSIGEAY